MGKVQKDYLYLADGVKVELGNNAFGGNNNTVIVGDTGSGKTYSVVVPFLLHTNQHSVVVTLSKKAMINRFQTEFIKKGYKVIVINLANPKESKFGYDIMNGIKSQQDMVFTAKALVGSPRGSEDRYWYETAASVLTAEIAYVMQDFGRKNQKPSFVDVLDLNKKLYVTECASGATRTSLDAFFACQEKFYPGNFASSCFKTIQGLPAKTLNCVLSTLNASLDKIFTEEIVEMMKIQKTLDIPKIGEEKTALFFVTSAVNPSLSNFINYFYADMFKQLFEHSEQNYEDGRLPVPVHIVCDDFACGGQVPEFAKYIAIFRAKGISVTLLLQSESQLTTMYSPHESQTILNNCATYVFFGSMDVDTCRVMSTKTNKPLDEIMFMPIDEVIVMRRGTKPYFGKRYRILEDELYQKEFIGKEQELEK